MFQHNSNSLPKPLINLSMSNSNIHGHNTRHRHDPLIRRRNTDKSKTFYT
jgi:hypothetical protein